MECPVWRRICRWNWSHLVLIALRWSPCPGVWRLKDGAQVCGCRLHRRWLRTSWWRELWVRKQSSPFTRQSQFLSTLAPVTSSEAIKVRSQRDGEMRFVCCSAAIFFVCVCVWDKARSSADVSSFLNSVLVTAYWEETQDQLVTLWDSVSWSMVPKKNPGCLGCNHIQNWTDRELHISTILWLVLSLFLTEKASDKS